MTTIERDACAAVLLLFTGARVARADGTTEERGSIGIGAGVLSVRGDDLASGRHAASYGSFDVGYRFPIGVRPELSLLFAWFPQSASATTSNVIVVAPGVRWSPSNGIVRPWVAAHFNLADFDFGGTCTAVDTAPGFVATRQRGCDSAGLRVGFDLTVGVDWRLSRVTSVGARMSWARTDAMNPPRQEPAPEGYPQPTAPSYVRSWIALGLGLGVAF